MNHSLSSDEHDPYTEKALATFEIDQIGPDISDLTIKSICLASDSCLS